MAAVQAFVHAYNHVNEFGSESRHLRMEWDHPLQDIALPKPLKRSSSDAKLKPDFATYRAPPALTGKFWQPPAKYKAVGAKRQMTVPGAYPDLDVEEPLYDHSFIPGFIKRFLPVFFDSSPPGSPLASKTTQFFPNSEPRPVGYNSRRYFTAYTRSGVGRSPTPRSVSSPRTVRGGVGKKSISPSKTSLANRLNPSKLSNVTRRGDHQDAPGTPQKRKLSSCRTGPDATYLDVALQHKTRSKHEAASKATPNMAPRGKWPLGRHHHNNNNTHYNFDELSNTMTSSERGQRFLNVRNRLQNLGKRSVKPRVESDKSSETDNTQPLVSQDTTTEQFVNQDTTTNQPVTQDTAKQLVTPPPETQPKADGHVITDGRQKTGPQATRIPKKGILRNHSQIDSDDSDELETDTRLPGMAGAIYKHAPKWRDKQTPSPTESTGSFDEITQDISNRFTISQTKRQELDEIDREAKEAEEAARRLEEEAERKLREEEFNKNAILKPLPQEWTDEVNSTIKKLENDPQYKLPGTHVGLSDIQKLLPSRYGGAGWLNDEVVNLYLNKVMTQTLDKEEWNKQAPKPVHSFGSQFWTSFSAGGHKAVASWTRRQKIQGAHFLSCRAAVIPICNGVHWTALVLSGTDRTIAYYDSMGGSGAPYVARVRDWLAGELGDKYLAGEWRELAPTPQFQANSSDCGVFACLNGHAALAGKVPIDVFRGGDVEATGRQHVAAVLAGMPAVV